eukprot:GDKK01052758.1.p1 GENE.GDKK01052758.1~~GDKK01052758.1.p1  ORF type:complete len:358 (+),score=104.25 GDKK01052758.1:33-1076(+)
MAGLSMEKLRDKPVNDMTEQEYAYYKKNKNKKDKPWDTPDIDKWKTVTISPEDNKNGVVEESSFATLFPAYREKYLKEVWSDVKRALKPLNIEAELDLIEGSMTVKTTRKTWDPYSIIKARDMIKLLSRSVPFPQALRILEDEMNCDIIKISGLVRNKERFAKRRQRLVGPNGSTLKALEILTGCYVLIQGQTVAAMGSFRGLKTLRRIVEDCMNNIHPVYHIKELMIRKELEKDESLKEEIWDRFLPQFRKKCVSRRKVREELKKKMQEKEESKKDKSLFPALPTPRKEDILIETGEYFASEDQKKMAEAKDLVDRQKQKSAERRRERDKEFIAPKQVKDRKLASI